MKTIVSLLLLILIFQSANAQLKKNQWMVGGVAEFSYDNSEETPNNVKSETKLTAYEVSPGIGYFFADRFCAGLRVSFVGLTNKNEFEASTIFSTSYSKSEIKNSGIGISPFLRYYFLPVGKKVNLFADASYAYTMEKSKVKSIVAYGDNQNPPTITESRSSRKLNSNNFMLAAGPAFFINQNVSFELTIGYGLKKEGKNDITTNRIMFGTGFQVFFGK